MTLYNTILAIVAVGVCIIALSALLPDVLLEWYSADTESMAFDCDSDNVGVLSWNMLPFAAMVIILLMFGIKIKNSF